MADETLLTAGNGTEGEGSAIVQAGDAAPAAADAGKAKTETPPQPAQGDKPADAAAEGQQDGPPEAYEYKLPEGFTVNEELKGEYDTLAREYGLSNDKAQKFIDLGAKLVQQTQDSLMEQITATQEQWLATTKADKEIGGAKLDEVRSVCSLVMEGLGSDTLKAALNETGIGNHPEVIRFVYRIGQELKVKEGGYTPAGSGGSVQKDPSQILFGGS